MERREPEDWVNVASALGASSRIPSVPSHLLAHLSMFYETVPKVLR